MDPMTMKSLPIAVALLAASPPAFALFPLLEHIDIRVFYQPASQSWQWVLATADEDADPSLAYFPARDALFPEGERELRPGGTEWDFLGVDEGELLWIYPESSSAYAWLGFDDTTSGLSDPVKFQLAHVEGPVGGHFSLFRTISATPEVFMSTVDGIDVDDVYAKPAGHHHLNWAFTRKGVWAVDFKVSAHLIAGNQPTAPGPTDTTRLFFAIGEKAAWQASRFDAATVMDETVAGDLADPDKDGWVNLLEYAFGGNPRQNGLKRGIPQVSAAPVLETLVHEGNTHAGITFYRHRDPERAELNYAVEWQGGLAENGWSEGGELHHSETIDANWERVTFRDSDPLPATPRFVRVRVTGE